MPTDSIGWISGTEGNSVAFWSGHPCPILPLVSGLPDSFLNRLLLGSLVRLLDGSPDGLLVGSLPDGSADGLVVNSLIGSRIGSLIG
jgi:hypothetical protein